MKWFKSPYIVIGLILGAAAGFAYWKFVGCIDGTCMITSKWPNSTAYGGMMGLLFGDMIRSSVEEFQRRKQSAKK
jgi:hypothetical protein